MLTHPRAHTHRRAARYAAWGHLVAAGDVIDPAKVLTLNYDIVNTGREVLAQIITVVEANLVDAVGESDRATAMKWADVLTEAYTDIDACVAPAPASALLCR